MVYIIKNFSFNKNKEKVKKIIATILCVSMITVDILPNFSIDTLISYANEQVASGSCLEVENEIIDEDLPLLGDEPDPLAEGNCMIEIGLHNLEDQILPCSTVLVRNVDYCFPIVNESLLGRRYNHFYGWRYIGNGLAGSDDAEIMNILNGGLILSGGKITGVQANLIYERFVAKGEGGHKLRLLKFQPVFVEYGTDEDDLVELPLTIDDLIEIDGPTTNGLLSASEDDYDFPDEALQDGKYALYFEYDSEVLGQEIHDNPIVVTSSTSVTFPTIDTSLVKDGCTFEGWERADILIPNGGTMTAQESRICSGLGEDKYVIFEARIDAPERYTIHFDIDNEYSDEVIPPIDSISSPSIIFPNINNLRGVEITSWKSTEGGYSYAPGTEILFSTLNFTNTDQYFFKPELVEKDIHIHFKNELPPFIDGEIPASRSDIVVKVNQSNPNEYQEYDIEGYKHEGWGLSNENENENEDVAFYVEDDNIDPFNFIKPGVFSYDLYPIFIGDKEKSKPYVPVPHSSGGSSGGGGAGGVPIYGANGEILGPSGKQQIEQNGTNGMFEFDPKTNQFKYFLLDASNNKQYVKNDWFKTVNQTTGKVKWYLTDPLGNILTGFVFCDGGFYYLSDDVLTKGEMLTGKVVINGIEYIFDENGKYIGDINKIPKVYKTIIRNKIVKNNDDNYKDGDLVYAFSGTINDDDKPPIWIEYYDKDDNFLCYQEKKDIHYNGNKDRYEFNIKTKDLPYIATMSFVGWEVIDSVSLNPKLYNSDKKLGTKKSWQFRAKYRDPYYRVSYYNQKYGKEYYFDRVEPSANYTLTHEIINKALDKLPKKAGYDFDGFTDGTNTYNEGHIFTEKKDIILYPKWQKKTTDVKYIKDICIGYSDDYASAINLTKGIGFHPYEVIDCDLNKGAGGDFMYLGVKWTTNKDEAINDLRGNCYKSIGHPSSISYDENFYLQVPTCYDNDTVDLNRNAGGKYVYLYYSKILPSMLVTNNKPITDLKVVAFEQRKFVSDFLYDNWRVVIDHQTGDILNFNEGCDNSAYIYVIYRCEGDLITDYIDTDIDIKYVNSKNWMSKIPGNRLITHINLPGTHDSGTFDLAVGKNTFAQCQDKTISEQLNLGVRFLDIRSGYDGTLNVYHGTGSIFKECNCYEKGTKNYLTVESALLSCIKFVMDNPTETVFFRLRHETRDQAMYRYVANLLLERYEKTNRLYMPSEDRERVPALSEVRGKVVILNDEKFKYKVNNIEHEEDMLKYGYKYRALPENDNDQGQLTALHAILKFLYEEFNGCVKDIKNLTKTDFLMYFTSCWGEPSVRILPHPRDQAEEINPWFLGKLRIKYQALINDITGECIKTKPYFLVDDDIPLMYHVEDRIIEPLQLKKGIYYGWIPMDFIDYALAEKIYRLNDF